MAEGLFTEVYKALRKISENISRADSQDPGVKAPDSRHHIAKLEGLLHKEKQEFEVMKASWMGLIYNDLGMLGIDGCLVFETVI